MRVTRREFVRQAGVGALSFWVAGCQRDLTPGEARTAGAELVVLSVEDAATLEALGEKLVPGSKAAGIAYFIDQQLGAAATDQLLMIRYLGVPAPFENFYKAGLSAANSIAVVRYGRAVAQLEDEQLDSLVADIAVGNVAGWDGPPAGFFYFVLRADAVDVVYGTQRGFADLNIPYMPHIQPPEGWGPA